MSRFFRLFLDRRKKTVTPELPGALLLARNVAQTLNWNHIDRAFMALGE